VRACRSSPLGVGLQQQPLGLRGGEGCAASSGSRSALISCQPSWGRRPCGCGGLNCVRDGDVLQVGMAAGEPSGGGQRLVEVGVNAAGFLAPTRALWQAHPLGAFELAQGCGPSSTERHNRVIASIFEHGRVGAPPFLSCAIFLRSSPRGVRTAARQLVWWRPGLKTPHQRLSRAPALEAARAPGSSRSGRR